MLSEVLKSFDTLSAFGGSTSAVKYILVSPVTGAVIIDNLFSWLDVSQRSQLKIVEVYKSIRFAGMINEILESVRVITQLIEILTNPKYVRSRVSYKSLLEGKNTDVFPYWHHRDDNASPGRAHIPYFQSQHVWVVYRLIPNRPRYSAAGFRIW